MLSPLSLEFAVTIQEWIGVGVAAIAINPVCRAIAFEVGIFIATWWVVRDRVGVALVPEFLAMFSLGFDVAIAQFKQIVKSHDDLLLVVPDLSLRNCKSGVNSEAV